MTKKTVSALLFLAAVLVAALPSGSARAAESLSLEKAVSIALEKNLDVLSAREELTRAEGNLVYARSGLFPSISLNGTASRRNEESSKYEEENVANVSLSQYLYAGGVISAGYEQARQTRVKAAQDVRNAEEAVALRVVEAYLSVLQKKADEETARDALSYYDNAARELGKRFELGLARKLDYSRAVQQRENAAADFTAARNALASARIDLLTLLRMPPGAEVEVAGDLEAGETALNRDGSLARALADRPDLQSLKTAAKVQRSAVEIARGGMKPIVTLSASYQLEYDSTPASSAEDDDWVATVTMKVPVFDGGLTRGKVMQAKATLNQAEQAASKREETVAAEVNQSVLSVESTFETVGAARKSLDLAAENLRLAEVGYREGVNTQLDVLSARTTLTEARQKLSSALKSYRVALAGLWKAEGALVEKVLKR
ncbi:MAG: TolC family protein [Synergistales bacterium]